MSGIVDRYTPSEPYPRLLLALVASSVPLALFLFGTVVVINAWRTAEALRGVPGLTLAALLVLTVLSGHVAHVLVGDVANRARGRRDDASETDEREMTSTDRNTTRATTTAGTGRRPGPGPDAQTTLERRYAAGELTDEEFERRLETLSTSPGATETEGGTADRLTE
jgi:hypothetical protein